MVLPAMRSIVRRRAAFCARCYGSCSHDELLSGPALLTMSVKRQERPCTRTMKLLSGSDSNLMERIDSSLRLQSSP
mgnify:CR=1 FL=1